MADWRKAEDYAYVKQLTLREWAWEFLRRNSEYRALWREYVALVTPDLGGQSVDEYHAPSLPTEINRRFRRFRLAYPINPERDAIQLRADLQRQWGGSAIRVFFTGDKLPESTYWNEVTVIFDLRLPLKGQLEAAGFTLSKRIALVDQTFAVNQVPATYKKKLPKINRRPDRWLIWIRVLDANLARAGTAEVGRVLFPPPPSSPRGGDPERSAQKALEKAKEYADSGYKNLIRQIDVRRGGT